MSENKPQKVFLKLDEADAQLDNRDGGWFRSLTSEGLMLSFCGPGLRALYKMITGRYLKKGTISGFTLTYSFECPAKRRKEWGRLVFGLYWPWDCYSLYLSEPMYSNLSQITQRSLWHLLVSKWDSQSEMGIKTTSVWIKLSPKYKAL